MQFMISANGSFEARLSGHPDELVTRKWRPCDTIINLLAASGGTVAFTIISRGADGLSLIWKSTGINFRLFDEIAPQIYRFRRYGMP